VHVCEEDEGAHAEAAAAVAAAAAAGESHTDASTSGTGTVHGDGPLLCGAPITITSAVNTGQHLQASKCFDMGDGGGLRMPRLLLLFHCLVLVLVVVLTLLLLACIFLFPFIGLIP
jgi:hypothetical protein